MPTTYPCAFTVPPGTTGGKLSGGFANGARPALQNGDGIAVSVSFTAGDSTAPTGPMQGIFVFTAAADAASNQATPSPFLFASQNYCCASSILAVGTTQGTNLVFNFAAFMYGGQLPGSYELTFIAINNYGTGQYQWSEDPEFETGN
jgi:hypothetical protein